MRVRIKKIKPWAIKFCTDKGYFLLHESESDYEKSVQLYQVHPEFDHLSDALNGRYNRYSLTPLAGKIGWLHGYDSRTKPGETYKSINQEKFLEQLCFDGFGKYVGLEDEYINKVIKNHKIKQIDEKLKDLRSQYEKLLREKLELLEIPHDAE